METNHIILVKNDKVKLQNSDSAFLLPNISVVYSSLTSDCDRFHLNS